jgi:hypothetical protein
MLECCSLSLVEPITLSVSKLYLLQRMASNDNNKCKLEVAKSSMKRKRLRLSDDDASDNDSSDSPKEEMEEEEEETEEEVSSEETLMKQLDTSEEKLFAKRGRVMIFSDDGVRENKKF